MVDRLKDLKLTSDVEQIAIDVNEHSSLTNGEGSKGGGGGMNAFFGDVDIVKSNINAIKDATKRIADINSDVAMAVNDKADQASAELQPLVEKTNKQAKTAKELLTALRAQTDKEGKNGTLKASELRIRDNLVITLTRKFVDVMKEYQNIQSKYKNDIKKKVKRQVQIVKADATPEEIDAVMKSGGSDAIFREAILKGEAADSIRNMFMNVQDKYQDVLALEASIVELHQMFLDFALLVDQQGELLDQIEHQVKAASDFIEKGNEDLVEATDLQKSIRRKQCCLILIVLVVIGVIIGGIVGSQYAQGKIGGSSK